MRIVLYWMDPFAGQGEAPLDTGRLPWEQRSPHGPYACYPFFFSSFFFLFSAAGRAQHPGHWLCCSRKPSVLSLFVSSVCIVILWFCFKGSKIGKYMVTDDYNEPKMITFFTTKGHSRYLQHSIFLLLVYFLLILLLVFISNLGGKNMTSRSV